ncbi:MAG: aminomethyl-transferring glycine dehydrogenase subunit GcvPA [Armatimonadetes bacterium]|nr:aminomethyl-transferring glycine dehydrogenase subunit GcvPA [Armatimonadota bacterium]
MRYVPHTEADVQAMLEAIGLPSPDALFDAIPETLRLPPEALTLEPGADEMSLRRRMQALADRNHPAADRLCLLGAGIYDHYIPAAVPFLAGRSEFATSYTPYQPEMSQGLLQGLYEYQSMTAALYGMEVSNASMYDGATALAEAVLMAADITRRPAVIVSQTLSPRYRAVLRTYLAGTGVRLEIVPYRDGATDMAALASLVTDETACVVSAWPNFFGCLEPVAEQGALAHAAGALSVVAALPVPLGLLQPPGGMGADIAVGEGQGLGLPMSYGGPLLGLFCCRREYLRKIPGRIVGASVDRDGKRAYTLTLQTREQHIKRERATSNICTSQALCAIGAAIYLGLMGPDGLRQAATLCLQGSHALLNRLVEAGIAEPYFTAPFFHEVALRVRGDVEALCRRMAESGIAAGYPLGRDYPELADGLLVCVTEKRTLRDIEVYARCMAEGGGDA